MFDRAEEAYSKEMYTGLGVAFLIVGPLISVIGSFFTYGFGELIVKTTEIANNMAKTPETVQPVESKTEPQNNGQNVQEWISHGTKRRERGGVQSL